MYKKHIIATVLIISLLASSVIQAFTGDNNHTDKIDYYYHVQNKDGSQTGLTMNTPHHINDGDLGTIAEIVYSGAYNEETGLLNESFYLLLDLGGTYDLSKLSVKWYPTSGRCVKYIVSGSLDGTSFTQIEDHSDNLTVSDTITDDNLNTKARFLRLEILGNFRLSDNTKNGYFIISELTVGGKLDTSKERILPYTVELATKEGANATISQPDISVYPTKHLYDRNLSSLYEIQYSGSYDSKGKLKDPFYLILDLGDVYELKSFELVPYLNVKGLKYKLAVSEDDINYTAYFDHSDNNEIITIKDSFGPSISGRYIRLEIFGNFTKSLTYNTYNYISEIVVMGIAKETKVETKNTIDYSYSLLKKEGEAGSLTFTDAPEASQVPENLKDGDMDSIAQIVYTGEYAGDLLKNSFYLILDLKDNYDLEQLLIKWYPTSKRCVKYKISISDDGVNYKEAADHSNNLTQYNIITDNLEGSTGRYLRIEILGNYRESDQTRNGFFVISEIEVLGSLSANNPETADSFVYSISSLTIAFAAFLVLTKKKVFGGI